MSWQCKYCSLHNYIESMKCIACFQFNKDAICANCSKKGASIKCDQCNQIYYCSQQCKTIDWKSKHSTECKFLCVEQNILDYNSSHAQDTDSTEQNISNIQKFDYNSFQFGDNSLIIPSDTTISLSSNKDHIFNYVIISKNGTLN
eukprot:433779_1